MSIKLQCKQILYSNPLPHVLILTAIVVGIATTSLGLALIVRIRESFNTIDEEDILQIEQKMTREDNQKYKDALKGYAIMASVAHVAEHTARDLIDHLPLLQVLGPILYCTSNSFIWKP